jgi:hypothetical protein
LVVVAACQPDEVSAPPSVQVEESPTDSVVAAAGLSALGVSIDDAVGRLAPALEDRATAVLVAAHLERLSRALADGNAAQARQALTDARTALGSAEQTPNGAAIGLALDRAEALLLTEGPVVGRSETGQRIQR